MALIQASGQSVITSPIQRILSRAESRAEIESIYVQTYNSTYLLEQTRDRDAPTP